ncbi:hypothetical protein wNo_01840 [Wolbachia endosymbiont of Drosophila simulans wNo]|uniref:hypothetical protein n=1 Tax=unclassified Wolbachia TaxID=2640676 RepID=UPI0002D25365|nr:MULTISPECIES: hypothetical protein [unclassified Wolbachia]AGJ98621.1 hypothetical protein wNo_01840 [Wolbachia endosymbiont of Drosophila simulans wNo]QCB62817.1 hypothetical protein EJA99_04490 [Wolbachia endosymbiont of Drosophila mauritiana]QCB63862.1 hypothetical protein EJB00_04475 [Wolbachia endosymbiont of Drosophila mauritiana]QWE33877.1 Uncharacterized protein WwMa_10000 [Wolbachia endosymbiont of Drosophila simulans]TGB07046.1 hypothetical protein E5C28_02100 [Wolbachia endosymbi
MKTETFERLIGQTRLRRNSKAEIIKLNRNKKAFIDEDKKSIELAEAIFAENNMFRFRKPGLATDYILHKLINDKKLLEEMKDRGRSIIRLFSLLSMYRNLPDCYVVEKEGCITEFGILTDVDECLESVPLEDFILIESVSYLEYILFDNNNIRNRLVEDLTKDKTKLDIFINGILTIYSKEEAKLDIALNVILAINSSDLVLSYINTMEAFDEKARNFVNHIQKTNRMDYLFKENGTTLVKLVLKELLKLSILQERENTTLEFPQISSVEHCNGR